MQLKSQLFVGEVLKEVDTKNKGRYKVYIPELMNNIPNTEGIWCRNRMMKYNPSVGHNGIYGSWSPLKIGSKVYVQFMEEDINSAVIVGGIIEERDGILNELMGIKDEDRDNVYMLMNTSKYGNRIFFTEDTTNGAKNSFQIRYNKKPRCFSFDDYVNKEDNLSKHANPVIPPNITPGSPAVSNPKSLPLDRFKSTFPTLIRSEEDLTKFIKIFDGLYFDIFKTGADKYGWSIYTFLQQRVNYPAYSVLPAELNFLPGNEAKLISMDPDSFDTNPSPIQYQNNTPLFELYIHKQANLLKQFPQVKPKYSRIDSWTDLYDKMFMTYQFDRVNTTGTTPNAGFLDILLTIQPYSSFFYDSLNNESVNRRDIVCNLFDMFKEMQKVLFVDMVVQLPPVMPSLTKDTLIAHVCSFFRDIDALYFSSSEETDDYFLQVLPIDRTLLLTHFQETSKFIVMYDQLAAAGFETNLPIIVALVNTAGLVTDGDTLKKIKDTLVRLGDLRHFSPFANPSIIDFSNILIELQTIVDFNAFPSFDSLLNYIKSFANDISGLPGLSVFLTTHSDLFINVYRINDWLSELYDIFGFSFYSIETQRIINIGEFLVNLTSDNILDVDISVVGSLASFESIATSNGFVNATSLYNGIVSHILSSKLVINLTLPVTIDYLKNLELSPIVQRFYDQNPPVIPHVYPKINQMADLLVAIDIRVNNEFGFTDLKMSGFEKWIYSLFIHEGVDTPMVITDHVTGIPSDEFEIEYGWYKVFPSFYRWVMKIYGDESIGYRFMDYLTDLSNMQDTDLLGHPINSYENLILLLDTMPEPTHFLKPISSGNDFLFIQLYTAVADALEITPEELDKVKSISSIVVSQSKIANNVQQRKAARNKNAECGNVGDGTGETVKDNTTDQIEFSGISAENKTGYNDTTFVIDEEGFTISTLDELNLLARGKINITADDDVNVTSVKADINCRSKDNTNIIAGKSVNITAENDVSARAKKEINIVSGENTTILSNERATLSGNKEVVIVTSFGEIRMSSVDGKITIFAGSELRLVSTTKISIDAPIVDCPNC